MARIILALFGVVLVAALALTLKSERSTDPVIPSSGPGAQDVLALPNGATMVASKGTVGRELIDWLADTSTGTRYFEVGGQEFVGASTELTPESRVRLSRLVILLEAHPDVAIRVVGYAAESGNPARDRQSSEQRARSVVEEIAASGISRSRLSFEGRGASDPIADNATAEGRARNERVALILTKGS